MCTYAYTVCATYVMHIYVGIHIYVHTYKHTYDIYRHADIAVAPGLVGRGPLPQTCLLPEFAVEVAGAVLRGETTSATNGRAFQLKPSSCRI